MHAGSCGVASLLLWVHVWNLVEMAIAKRFTPDLRWTVGLQASMRLRGSKLTRLFVSPTKSHPSAAQALTVIVLPVVFVSSASPRIGVPAAT
jgi:hypothetical protein